MKEHEEVFDVSHMTSLGETWINVQEIFQLLRQQ